MADAFAAIRNNFKVIMATGLKRLISKFAGLTIFNGGRRLQLFGLQFGPGELQRLREEMEASHVEKQLK